MLYVPLEGVARRTGLSVEELLRKCFTQGISVHRLAEGLHEYPSYHLDLETARSIAGSDLLVIDDLAAELLLIETHRRKLQAAQHPEQE